ncbi:MAG: hypothetical protein WCS37_18675, partial [Chloroflexota bacterium]
ECHAKLQTTDVTSSLELSLANQMVQGLEEIPPEEEVGGLKNPLEIKDWLKKLNAYIVSTTQRQEAREALTFAQNLLDKDKEQRAKNQEGITSFKQWYTAIIKLEEAQQSLNRNEIQVPPLMQELKKLKEDCQKRFSALHQSFKLELERLRQPVRETDQLKERYRQLTGFDKENYEGPGLLEQGLLERYVTSSLPDELGLLSLPEVEEEVEQIRRFLLLEVPERIKKDLLGKAEASKYQDWLLIFIEWLPESEAEAKKVLEGYGEELEISGLRQEIALITCPQTGYPYDTWIKVYREKCQKSKRFQQELSQYPRNEQLLPEDSLLKEMEKVLEEKVYARYIARGNDPQDRLKYHLNMLSHFNTILNGLEQPAPEWNEAARQQLLGQWIGIAEAAVAREINWEFTNAIKGAIDFRGGYSSLTYLLKSLEKLNLVSEQSYLSEDTLCQVVTHLDKLASISSNSSELSYKIAELEKTITSVIGPDRMATWSRLSSLLDNLIGKKNKFDEQLKSLGEKAALVGLEGILANEDGLASEPSDALELTVEEEINALDTICQILAKLKAQQWPTAEGRLPEDLQRLEVAATRRLQENQYRLLLNVRDLRLNLIDRYKLITKYLRKQLNKKDWMGRKGSDDTLTFHEGNLSIESIKNGFIEEYLEYEEAWRGLSPFSSKSIAEAKQKVEQAFDSKQYGQIDATLKEFLALLQRNEQLLYPQKGLDPQPKGVAK